MVSKKINYQGKVGCWNCNTVYNIAVKLGTPMPEYLMKKKTKCRHCGCDTIRMFSEYVVNKKIMKDLVLQGKLDEMSKPPKSPIKHDHYK